MPLLDEDHLILSKIHSAKGQEWKSVFVLNAIDGCIPSDHSTGTSPEIEEERRLLDVAFILLFRSASSPWPETRRAIGTYVGQIGFAKKDHQVCLAHLIRYVQYAIDAPDLRHLPVRACRIGQRRERLANATLKTYATWLDARLDELMARQPTHEAGIKLQPMIKRTRRYLFVFATNRNLPATNNGSERALRPCAVFREITIGFRTEWGAKLGARMKPSLVSTTAWLPLGIGPGPRTRNRLFLKCNAIACHARPGASA